MTTDPHTVEHWWLALVTFERRDASPTEFLPDQCQGAAGWMACRASNGEVVRDLIEAALHEAGVRLVEISSQTPAESIDYIQELDPHLAMNIGTLESGKSVVWGTIRTYRADGEA